MKETNKNNQVARKENHEKESYKRALFMLHRSEILKERRAKARQKAIAFRMKFERVKMWFRLMRLVTVMKMDLYKSGKNIELYLWKVRMKKYVAKFAKLRFKAYMQKFGTTVERRNNHTLIQSLIFVDSFKRKLAEDEAMKVLTDSLPKMMAHHALFYHSTAMHNKIS